MALPVHIHGDKTTGEVRIDGELISETESFKWGHANREASKLACSILTFFAPIETAVAHHQSFMQQYLMQPELDVCIDVDRWLDNRTARVA